MGRLKHFYFDEIVASSNDAAADAEAAYDYYRYETATKHHRYDEIYSKFVSAVHIHYCTVKGDFVKVIQMINEFTVNFVYDMISVAENTDAPVWDEIIEDNKKRLIELVAVHFEKVKPYTELQVPF